MSSCRMDRTLGIQTQVAERENPEVQVGCQRSALGVGHVRGAGTDTRGAGRRELGQTARARGRALD